MQKKLPVVLFISTLLFLTAFFLLQKKQTSFNQQKVTIRNHTFMVEVADTDRLREKGLSGRKDLSPNTGMLFLFPQKGIYSFWMKNMLFPLDFIWIDGDIIVDLTQNVPPPLPSSSFPPTYAPKTSFDTVLEVSAGTIAAVGIKLGDKVAITQVSGLWRKW